MVKSKFPEAILIHGWDPNYYNKNILSNSQPNITWSQRTQLLELLSQKYDLKFFNLPGFGGISEPKQPFNLEKFADKFAEWKKHKAPKTKLIIAYSFGGAVALTHKVRYKDFSKLVLISPAIIRKITFKSKIAKALKVLVPPQLNLKNFYQQLASPYYRQGTPFLKSSYDLIVRRDLRDLLNQVNSRELLLIYGENDQDTPWFLVKNQVLKNKIRYHLIRNGRHNIGQTHPVQIIKLITDFG